MTKDINFILNRLEKLNENTPIKRKNPSEKEVESFEQKYKIIFPKEYKAFLLQCSNVNYSTLQPGIIIPEKEYYSLDVIMKDGWALGIDRSNLPFCEDNGDYFYITPAGEVFFWSLDGKTNEFWQSFSEWIEAVWFV
jgi:hypothetical protein